MSAFLVSKKHIDCLVHARSYAARGASVYYRLANELSDSDLGRLLWRENMKSTESRYPNMEDMAIDETLLESYSYTVGYDSDRYTIVEMFKAIHCFQYQACEHDGWEKSDAAYFCRQLEKQLIRKLPGYDEAPWGIENETTLAGTIAS